MTTLPSDADVLAQAAAGIAELLRTSPKSFEGPWVTPLEQRLDAAGWRDARLLEVPPSRGIRGDRDAADAINAAARANGRASMIHRRPRRPYGPVILYHPELAQALNEWFKDTSLDPVDFAPGDSRTIEDLEWMDVPTKRLWSHWVEVCSMDETELHLLRIEEERDGYTTVRAHAPERCPGLWCTEVGRTRRTRHRRGRGYQFTFLGTWQVLDITAVKGRVEYQLYDASRLKTGSMVDAGGVES